MTRINCIPPDELTREHLIAEYRELPRVFGLVRRAVESGVTPESAFIPETYRLGTGHVRFFYDKLGYVKKRYSELVNEMISRGYNVQYPEPDTDGIPDEWFGDWEPTDKAMGINRSRISERLNK